MLFTKSTILALYSVCLASGANAVAVKPRYPQDPQCGEDPVVKCYGKDKGVSQGLKLDDIFYVARIYRNAAIDGLKKNTHTYLVLPPDGTCGQVGHNFHEANINLEFKHIHPEKNTWVSYFDIAHALDGFLANGTNGYDGSLYWYCQNGGGEMAITPNYDLAAYNSKGYKENGCTPEGAYIKLEKAYE